MADKKTALRKYLVVERGMVAGSGARLVPGVYAIGTEVSEDAARLAIVLGKAHDADRKGRVAAAPDVTAEQPADGS